MELCSFPSLSYGCSLSDYGTHGWEYCRKPCTDQRLSGEPGALELVPVLSPKFSFAGIRGCLETLMQWILHGKHGEGAFADLMARFRNDMMSPLNWSIYN
jgi:hypothetical protein